MFTIVAASLAILLLASLGTERNTRAGAPTPAMELAPAYNMYTCPAPYTADYCAPVDVAFTVAVSVTDAGAGYIGIQTEIDYGSLHYNAAAMADPEVVWPDAASPQLRSPASPTGDEGLVNHGAVTSFPPPYPTSTFTGPIVQISLMCDDIGADNVIDLVPSAAGNTNGSDFTTSPSTHVPAAPDSITVRCIFPSPQPGLDSDSDGCTDLQEEEGSNQELGGRRNFINPWDFYDIDGNKTIDLFYDIYTVAYAYGLTPGDLGYDPVLDRSRPPNPNEQPDAGYREAWDMGPPNGTIDLFTDVFGVAMQYGHHCL